MSETMTAVFYRSPGFDYPAARQARGMRITDAAGKEYLDMSGGAAVSCLGHGHPVVVDAIIKQLEAFEFAHTAFFTNEPQERLASLLVHRFGDPAARAYFTSGGSEANETALKMAWQYWAARGQSQRKIIISRDHSYHGNTFGALSVSGNNLRRAASAAPLLDWPRISAFYPYRGQASDESLESYTLRVADELESAIELAGAEQVAAFICEPVVGSSLGVVPAGAGYLERIRAICDKHDILLIFDEIMCGSGRTGSYFAHEQDGVKPDLVTLAKGISGGYQPLAATLINGKVAETLLASGFIHGHTYVGHPVACAAGVAVQEVLDREELLPRALDMGEQFAQLLQDRFGAHPHVGEIRGRGLFRGMELVQDRDTRAGFPGGSDLPERLRLSAMEHGLICYPFGISLSSGFVPHIMLAPPLILEERHMAECADKLDAVLSDVLKDSSPITKSRVSCT